MYRKIVIGLLVFLILLPTPLFAVVASDTNRFIYGFQRLFLAPFQLPYQLLQGTFYGPPVVGTLQGAFLGTFQTLSGVVGGVFDMAAAAAPYAKYAAFAF